jgi:DNA-binding transcriptional ArsR family regulator
MSSDTDEGFDEDKVFRALAARTRREILDLLKDRPRTTGEVCAAFADLDRCTVMQHLGVLDDAGLVIVQRRGRERWNHLSALPIQHIHDRWIGPYAAAAVGLLDRLRVDVEAAGRR